MKIYISPSVQEKNIGVENYGTEEQRMNQIADVVMRVLALHKNIELKRNTVDMDWTGIRDGSNNWHADYHIAIHSNAGGGQGTEVYHYVDGTENNSLKLARRVYNKVAPLTPGVDRGLKSGMNLFEVNDTIVAASMLIEIGFHDNYADEEYIVGHIEALGVAIAQGLLDHLSVDRNIDVGLIQNVVETIPQVVEKIVYVDRPVEVIKYVDKIVNVEVPVEKIVNVEVPGPIEYKDKIVEKEIIKEIEKEYSLKELLVKILKLIKGFFVKL